MGSSFRPTFTVCLTWHIAAIAVVNLYAKLNYWVFSCDVCLEAEASPQSSKSSASASPLRFDASLSRLWSWYRLFLRYDITSLFVTFIHSSYVGLYMCLRPLRQTSSRLYVYNKVFRCKLNVFGVSVAS